MDGRQQGLGSPRLQDVRRVANRAKREALARFGPARQLMERRHEQRARQHAALLRPLDATAQATVDQLERDAVAHPSFDDLAGERAGALRAGLDSLITSLAADEPAGRSTLRPSDEDLMAQTELWQWGLSDRLLDIAEHYLGVPVWYYGADVRREVADGQTIDVRQWHRDNEDRRVLKILMWLSDVGDRGGPFAYLTPPESDDASSRLRYVSGFVSDEKMRSVVPAERWQFCPGPKWHVSYIDTVRLMHRATPPLDGDRYSVTFTWTSRHPVSFHDVPSARATNAHQALHGLDARQRDALAPQWARVAEAAATAG